MHGYLLNNLKLYLISSVHDTSVHLALPSSNLTPKGQEIKLTKSTLSKKA